MPQYTTVCFLPLFLNRVTIITSQKLVGIIYSPHMLVKMLWNVSRVSGSATLKTEAGKPSFSDALLTLVCLIAFLISSKVGGRSRSSIIAFCGIKSKAIGSTVDGLLSGLEKCFLYHSMMIPFSLSKVLPSDESKGVVLGYEGPYTALRDMKNALKLLLLENCIILSAILFHYLVVSGVPSWLCSSGIWNSLQMSCHIILPFYKGIALFFQKLVDLLLALIKPVLVDPCLWPKNSFADFVTICLNRVHFSFGSSVGSPWACHALLRSEQSFSLPTGFYNLVVLKVAWVSLDFPWCIVAMWRLRKDLISLWSVQYSASLMALVILTSQMSCLWWWHSQSGATAWT